MGATRLAIVALIALMAGACGGSSSSPTAPSSPAPASPPAPVVSPLSVQGDPESPRGATWSYRETRDGVVYDLSGILLKPAGRGPFPAVIISHGAGGNVEGYSRDIASVMVTWGVVAIATNYTHAGGAPLGSPGTPADAGSSQANILRAHAVFGILRLLGYVDMNRVAAHGHSAGAFVTSAVLDAYPADFRVASHTAGGVLPAGIFGAAPNETQVLGIRTPYQLHHGEADIVVPVGSERRLADVLRAIGVRYELYTYPGAEHNDVSRDAVVLGRVRAWYTAHGLF